MKINQDLIIGETNKSLNGVVTDINNLKGKILWSNPSPQSSVFNPQTVTLSSDDYDVLEVFYIRPVGISDTSLEMLSTKNLKGYDGFISSIARNINKVAVAKRDFKRISDTQYSISTATYYYEQTEYTSNTWLIPIMIVGYKI